MTYDIRHCRELPSVYHKNVMTGYSSLRLHVCWMDCSIFTTLSKIYEKVLYQQMYEYFDKMFSKHLYVDSERFKAHSIVCYLCWNP